MDQTTKRARSRVYLALFVAALLATLVTVLIFRTHPRPLVRSFSPSSSRRGAIVTISGSNLAGVSDVTFGNESAAFTVDSDVRITAVVPLGARSGRIQVSSAGGTATSPKPIEVTLPPEVTSISPPSGPAGTVVNVSGANFSNVSEVRFGPSVASFTVGSSTELTAKVPAGAWTGLVSVTDAGGLGTSTAPFDVVHAPGTPPPASTMPIGPGTVWGIYATGENGLSGQETIDRLESQVGRSFGGQRIYTGMDETLPTDLDLRAATEGRLIYHNVNSWTLVDGQKVCVRWADIAAGKWDSWLTTQAQNVREWGYPILMSFTHEPGVNTQQHPLCGTPDEYRAAYDHVVQVFRSEGATNVKWVWTLTSSTFNGANGGPTVWEPASYDYVGVDGYNHSYKWRSPQGIFQTAENFAKLRGKPLLIGEIGCDELSGNPQAKADWITEAAAFFKSQGDVAAIMWTDTGNGGDYWLDSSPQALAAFTAAGHDPYFS